MKTDAVFVPVASGKGGVGKTFFAGTLAALLSEAGRRVIAVDLDLGGSNLHYFLGVHNRHPGVGDFLKARSGELPGLLVQTRWPNLRFLPGDGKTPLMANINWGQKERLLNHLKRLEADFVILDLGAGTAFNTLDFFAVARRSFVLTLPEFPSVMNMQTFLKNFIFRVVERSCRDHAMAREALRKCYEKPIAEQTMSVSDLLVKIGELDPEIADGIRSTLGAVRPRLVFNMVRQSRDLGVCPKILETVRGALGIEIEFFGFVPFDPAVQQALSERVPLLPKYSGSAAAAAIGRIAARMAKYWDRSIANSVDLLQAHAAKIMG